MTVTTHQDADGWWQSLVWTDDHNTCVRVVWWPPSAKAWDIQRWADQWRRVPAQSWRDLKRA